MKICGCIFIFLFAICTHAAELGYPSYAGSIDQGLTPLHPDTPLHEVQDTTIFPYRTIGRLNTGCTATLIGRREIITAAHCVYSMKNNEFYTDLDFAPAQSGNNLPYGTKEWERVRAPTEWTDEHDDDFDFAVITLKENVGDSLGWLGMKVENNPYKKTVQISGYAGQKPFGTMWHSKCNLLSPGKNWLDYKCETQSGMSGSAVVQLDDFDRNYQVIGVHALGGEQYNSGVRITSSVYKMIQSWK